MKQYNVNIIRDGIDLNNVTFAKRNISLVNNFK